MRIFLVILISLLLNGCGQREFGNLGIMESKGAGSKSDLSWSENLIPVKIRLPRVIESEIYQSVYYAVEEWNTKADRPLLFFEFVDMPQEVPNENYDSVNNFYSQVNWSSTGYSFSVLAITKFRYLQGSLLEADIILNETKSLHYRDPIDNILLFEYDVQSILVHEFGHFLGFEHSNEVDSVMKTTLSSGRLARILSTNDVIRLKAKY